MSEWVDKKISGLGNLPWMMSLVRKIPSRDKQNNRSQFSSLVRFSHGSKIVVPSG